MQIAVVDSDCVLISVSGLELGYDKKRTGMQGLVNITDKLHYPSQCDCARGLRCGIAQHSRIVVISGDHIGYLLFAVYLVVVDAGNVSKCVDAQVEITSQPC